jgi:hypothetical protein
VKLELIDSPTERTTSATDVLLAIQGFGWAWYIYSIGDNAPWKANVWAWAFGLMGLASLLGAIVHGFKIHPKPFLRTWRVIALTLGITIALFLVGLIYDLLGYETARLALPAALAMGVGFFAITFISPATFLVFVIYETCVLLLAVFGYGWLAYTGQLPGAGLILIGIFLTLVASGIQAGESLKFTLIWEFDHNGIFHLIQLVANVVVLLGLRMALLG